MKYYRFMGKKELDALLSGETLENHTEWNKGKGIQNTSKGFCFFDCLVSPEERLKYAYGAFHELDPYVVVFKPAAGTLLRTGQGLYARPIKPLDPMAGLMLNWQNMLTVKEYSIEEYNRKIMKPVKIGKPKHGSDYFEWHIAWKDVK